MLTKINEIIIKICALVFILGCTCIFTSWCFMSVKKILNGQQIVVSTANKKTSKKEQQDQQDLQVVLEYLQNEKKK